MIESFPEGAVARRGPVRAIFSPDLNAETVFDLQAPNGRRLRGGARSLHLTDVSTGRSVLLGTVRDTVPGELHPPNQVIYRDAFEGLVQADVVLTWKHNAFSQDVVFVTRPELPPGFNPDTTRIEVATEFLDAPEPRFTPALRRQQGAPDRIDAPFLRFGGLDIVPGWAFPVKDGQGVGLSGQVSRDSAAPVEKEWIRDEGGRTFLLETVSWSEVRPHFEKLAAADATDDLSHAVALHRVLPPPVQNLRDLKPIQLASAAYRQNGYLLDFIIVPETPTTTFYAKTYLVRTTYYISSAATFKPGCVIKYYGGLTSLVLYGSQINFPSRECAAYLHRLMMTFTARKLL